MSRAPRTWAPAVSAKLAAAILLLSAGAGLGAERFPPPEFEGGYKIPEAPPPPAPRHELLDYADLAALVVALSAASYLALKCRSRRGLLVLTLLSLAYFGFWRKGCVCSIGAIQNVAMAVFGSAYAAPLVVVGFFLLPLAFTLFFGRTFCAAVCPLGAIQDVVLIRPLRVPRPLEHALGLLPYVYLAAAVVLAATGSAFIICRYDPFVGFFRLGGPANMLVLGGAFLVVSAFIGRPYCRFLCPYGALLRQCSKASRWHATITPDECIQCRLCEDACPFNAIAEPAEPVPPSARRRGKTRLAGLLVLLPILVAGGGWLGGHLATALSQIHPTVRTAERVRLEETGAVEGTTDASDAFRATGKTTAQLYSAALAVRKQFSAKWTLWRRGRGGRTAVGWAHVLGAFVGLAVAAKLLSLSVHRRRTDYLPDRAGCVSCGRCFSYCPRERQRLKKTGREVPTVEA